MARATKYNTWKPSPKVAAIAEKHIGNLTLRRCANYSVHIERLQAMQLDLIRAHLDEMDAESRARALVSIERISAGMGQEYI